MKSSYEEPQYYFHGAIPGGNRKTGQAGNFRVSTPYGMRKRWRLTNEGFVEWFIW